jgi:hypothetical protein
MAAPAVESTGDCRSVSGVDRAGRAGTPARELLELSGDVARDLENRCHEAVLPVVCAVLNLSGRVRTNSGMRPPSRRASGCDSRAEPARTGLRNSGSLTIAATVVASTRLVGTGSNGTGTYAKPPRLGRPTRPNRMPRRASRQRRRRRVHAERGPMSSAGIGRMIATAMSEPRYRSSPLPRM